MRFALGTCSFPTGKSIDFVATHDRIENLRASVNRFLHYIDQNTSILEKEGDMGLSAVVTFS